MWEGERYRQILRQRERESKREGDRSDTDAWKNTDFQWTCSPYGSKSIVKNIILFYHLKWISVALFKCFICFIKRNTFNHIIKSFYLLVGDQKEFGNRTTEKKAENLEKKIRSLVSNSKVIVLRLIRIRDKILQA